MTKSLRSCALEKVLIRLARQLNAYDEASLMSLWERYATIVQQFEPTKRWEESALVFGLIQALRWKNQLFNYNWALETRPKSGDLHDVMSESDTEVDPLVEQTFFSVTEKENLRDASKNASKGKQSSSHKRTKVLRFRPREGDETS